MDKDYKFLSYRNSWLIVFPLGFAISSVWLGWIPFALSILMMFIVIALIPDFKHREVLGVEFLMLICSPFFNISSAFKLLRYFGYGFDFAEVVFVCIFYIAVVSVEQLLVVFVARLIWKKQFEFCVPECE